MALAMAGVSLAGLIATLAFLLVKRKIPHREVIGPSDKINLA